MAKTKRKKHSVLGASSAYRWFSCPGSVALIEQAPDQKPSEYAMQGTFAHSVIEECFKNPGVEPQLPDTWTDEETDAIQLFLNTVQDDRKAGKYILESEIKFELERIYKGLFGTCDIVLLSSDLTKLKVYDYKHGAGVPVEVENNKQLLYYALGAIQEMDKKHVHGAIDTLGWGSVFKEVEIIICQPRCRHKDGAVRRWTVSAEVLDNFAVELEAAAKIAMQPDAPLHSGDHCRFCAAQAICPAIAEKALAIAQTDFGAVNTGLVKGLPAPDALTKEQIGKVLGFSEVLEGWLKSVEAYALDCLQKGQDVPGFKLVKKRANRAWKDENQAAEVLAMYLDESQLWEKKFTSPAKVDKLLKKDKAIVSDLITVPDNGNTIAPIHDPREAVKGTAESDFGMIAEQQIDKEE